MPDIICKGGAAAPAGKRYGIKAYPAAENSTVPDGAVFAVFRNNQLAIQYLIIKQTHLRGESVSLVAYVGGLLVPQYAQFGGCVQIKNMI